MAQRQSAAKRRTASGENNGSRQADAASTFRQTSQSAARRSREAVTSAGEAVVQTVKQHPLPAALLGAGLAWLLLETRPARKAEAKVAKRVRGAAAAVSEPFSGVPQAARSAFKESAEHARQSVRSGAGALGEYARDGVTAVGRTAQRGYLRGRETLSEQWERHPLAMGLALLGAGLASGMLLPSSRRESETFGKASDDLSRRVKETSAEMLDRGRELLASSRRAVERASRREGLSPSNVGKKMRRVVKRAARAASES
jgi:hypothetical protein